MTKVYLRDIDGTGSLHVCSKGDPGAICYTPEALKGDLLEALDAILAHTDGWDAAQLRKRWDEKSVNEILAARAARSKAKGVL